MATVTKLFPRPRGNVHTLKPKHRIESDYKITPTRKDEFVVEWDGEPVPPYDIKIFGNPILLNKAGYVLAIKDGIYKPIGSWNQEKNFSGKHNKKNVITISMS